jgi:hypothetical protein
MISSKPLAKATQEKNLRLLLSISKMLGKEWVFMFNPTGMIF